MSRKLHDINEHATSSLGRETKKFVDFLNRRSKNMF